MKHVHADDAYRICVDAARRRGVSQQHAYWVADALVQSSLMGIDTHGLRLLPLYLRELDEGRSKAAPDMRVQRQSAGAILLNADSALGTVAATHAADLAAGLAKEQGIGAVAVINSNHFGAASIYAKRIARLRMLAVVTTSAAARMAPYNGARAMFGTNPLCFAAPAGGEDCYLLDMATSQVSYSRVKHFRQCGMQIPEGWILDGDGLPTTAALPGAMLAPLGGYKGQGLAMMVQMLTCVLTGMPLDHTLTHLDTGSFAHGREIAHLLIAINPAALTDVDAFEARVRSAIDLVRSTPGAGGQQVRVAGDPEQAAFLQRSRDGIPLTDAEYEALIHQAPYPQASSAGAPQ